MALLFCFITAVVRCTATHNRYTPENFQPYCAQRFAYMSRKSKIGVAIKTKNMKTKKNLFNYKVETNFDNSIFYAETKKDADLIIREQLIELLGTEFSRYSNFKITKI